MKMVNKTMSIYTQPYQESSYSSLSLTYLPHKKPVSLPQKVVRCIVLLNLDPQICVFSLLSNETEISHKAHEHHIKARGWFCESIYGPVGAFSMEHPWRNDQETELWLLTFGCLADISSKTNKWACNSRGEVVFVAKDKPQSFDRK